MRIIRGHSFNSQRFAPVVPGFFNENAENRVRQAKVENLQVFKFSAKLKTADGRIKDSSAAPLVCAFCQQVGAGIMKEFQPLCRRVLRVALSEVVSRACGQSRAWHPNLRFGCPRSAKPTRKSGGFPTFRAHKAAPRGQTGRFRAGFHVKHGLHAPVGHT